MPLTTDATLAQIIAALQSYQGINQKADLASVIGTPSTATDAMATLVQAVQTQKNTMASRLTSYGVTAAGTEALAALAGKIPIVAGKRSASGTLSTPIEWGSSGTITGLSFVPKIILLGALYQTGLTTSCSAKFTNPNDGTQTWSHMYSGYLSSYVDNEPTNTSFVITNYYNNYTTQKIWWLALEG